MTDRTLPESPTEAELSSSRAEMSDESSPAFDGAYNFELLVYERALRNRAEQEVHEWREAFASIDNFDWAPKPLRPSDLRAYAGGSPTLAQRCRQLEAELAKKTAEAYELRRELGIARAMLAPEDGPF